MVEYIPIIIAVLGGFLVVLAIAQLVCKRMMRKKVSPEITKLGRRVQQIEQQLKSLAQKEKSDGINELRGKLQILSQQIQQMQAQMTRPQTDEQLPARLTKLEQRVYSGEKLMIDQVPPYIQPKATHWVKDEYRQASMTSRDSVDPEKVALNLLNLIEPEGRRSQLARMAGLNH